MPILVNNHHKYSEYLGAPNAIIIGGSDLSHWCSPKCLNSSCTSPSHRHRAHENISRSPCRVHVIIGGKICMRSLYENERKEVFIFLINSTNRHKLCKKYNNHCRRWIACLWTDPSLLHGGTLSIIDDTKEGSSFHRVINIPSHTGQSRVPVIGGHRMYCFDFVSMI